MLTMMVGVGALVGTAHTSRMKSMAITIEAANAGRAMCRHIARAVKDLDTRSLTRSLSLGRMVVVWSGLIMG